MERKKEWVYENKWHEGNGIENKNRLTRPIDDDKIDLLYALHARQYDISSERELLMDTIISMKDKLRILTEKCNESIREKNKIWFTIGRTQRLDWHNEIPNLYL
ncbi:hypothetical protein ACFE6N_02725 [Pedobacter sp. BG31]|uniref:hypothetical protein n=1 Tax=Pedobacter sp. BG31 TaxID=3349697 RepID=UPI0035F443E7